MNSLPHITTIILVGGRGRRMEGKDKASLITTNRGEKETFLERLLSELRQLENHPIVLSMRPGQKHPAKGYPVVFDQYPNTGPMGALLSCMEAQKTDWFFLLACDVPCFKAEIFERLYGLITCYPEARAIIPIAANRRQTTVALYHRTLKADLAKSIQLQQYSFNKMLDHLGDAQVLFWNAPKEQERFFLNINRPEDLELL